MLAKSLGRTLAELEETITAEEYGLWVAYYGLEPWGEMPAWNRMGILASIQANIHRTADARPFTPADFIPGAQTEPLSEEIDPAQFARML